MNNPEVSIIIPIYNVAPFIERCVRSLFEQTFKDVEYIFIDDSTPDNSVEILEKITAQYQNKNVRIIRHDNNKGLAAARRTGIENSTGKYILMCDSDDYIEPNMVQLLHEKATAENADITVCDIIFEYADGRKEIRTDEVLQDCEENFYNMLVNEVTQGYLVNKLVVRSLYENSQILVPDRLDYLEDWYVSLRLYYFAKKIAKVPEALYHYVQYNTNAITKKITRNNFLSAIYFHRTTEDFLSQHGLSQKYSTLTAFLKIQTKVRLFWGVKQSSLRHEFSSMFLEEEKSLLKKQKLPDRLLLIFSRHRATLWLTSLLRFLVVMKKFIACPFALICPQKSYKNPQ
ncbi:MAG: glycosyltransferase family 2 protein [Bacteroidales bacterium]|jgi:glycosyltransferase involved in cell wall biosynthesis|nr:glycosyltransferase family 2 protein [Bacteroidales bacterium]